MVQEFIKDIKGCTQDLICIEEVSFKLKSLQILEYITQFLNKIEENKELDTLKKRKIQFLWSYRAKEFSKLLRDISFRIFKENQLLLDKKIDPFLYEEHNTQSESILQKALNEITTELESILNNNNEIIEDFKHYKSPIPSIIEQIKELKKHIQLTQSAALDLNKLRVELGNQLIMMDSKADEVHREFKIMHDIIADSKNYILDCINSDGRKITTLRSNINKKYDSYDTIIHAQEINKILFPTREDSIIPIQINAGDIITKEINFKDNIDSFLESKIYPHYIDANQILDKIRQSSLTVLFNSINRLKVVETEVQNVDYHLNLLKEALEKQDAVILETEEKVSGLIHKIQTKWKSYLVTSRIFDTEHLFLPFETAQKYDIKKKRELILERLPFEKATEEISKQFNRIFNQKKSNSSGYADMIKYISHRSVTKLDQFDQALFFSKGYMGRSFFKERQGFSIMLNEAYAKWKNGFSGSILIYGERLSGKSTLLESIETLLPATVNLQPNCTISISGRKFKTDFNLKSALQFIQQQAILKPITVLIDDLELWRDKENSLLNNMEELLNAMSKNYKRIFFLVSTNQWLKMKLDNQLQFSKEFTNIYCTNNMPTKDIVDAIMVRQGASLQNVEISTPDDSPTNSPAIAKKIARDNFGNIGNSLKEWSVGKDEDLNSKDYNFALAQFHEVIKANIYIIKHLLRFKQTTEIELRSDTNDELMQYLNKTIRQLLGFKILERRLDGTLIINEMIVNDIEIILNQKIIK